MNASRAGVQDTTSIGFSGSYGNFDVIGGEVYLKKQIRMFRQPIELKAGVNYRPYTLELHDLTDLKAQSVGVFGDLIYYPIRHSGFLVGLRWEAVNLNWLSNASIARYQEAKGESINSVYSGTCLFLQAGYQFKLGDIFRLRLYGQPGVQQFGISSVGSTSQNQGIAVDYQPAEKHYRFIYNLNAGIEFRIK